jgi:Right handed beta helix region
MHMSTKTWIVSTILCGLALMLPLGCSEDDAPDAPDFEPVTSACIEPLQGPVGTDWPEVVVGLAGCDDSGPGTAATPVCHFAEAIARLPEAPGILTIQDGTYRLEDHWEEDRGSFSVSRPGTKDAYFVIRAAQGAHPVLVGSVALDGSDFEDAGDGLFRADVSHMVRDTKGLWTADGSRMAHIMETRDGVRSHANVADLVEPSTWTKADAGGTGCDSDNEGCFIYVRPATDLDVPATDFEVSQGHFTGAIGSTFMVMRGLTFRFTQPTAAYFENAHHVLIEDCDFGHNANSNDNSYSVQVWSSQGALLRRNKAFDSRYWGGAVNSHGLTFMITGDATPVWACDNEVWDIIGHGISIKGGVSNLHVVGNYIHDVGNGIHVSASRCHWQGCDVHHYPGGAWIIHENICERCGNGVYLPGIHDNPDHVFPSYIFNNLFIDCDSGVSIAKTSPMPLVRNNLFVGGDKGLHLNGAGDTTNWADLWLDRGLDSDYNLFFECASSLYVTANWSGAERAMTLDEYRADFGDEYGVEQHSLEADPLLDADYRPGPGSPALNAGDPSVYRDDATVHLGIWP